MSRFAIQAVGLSKQYRIGMLRSKYYQTIREHLYERAARLFKPSSLPVQKTIWALEDVSFEVKEGEVLGIIGRNGAGKTTLLRLLSRITDPTNGYADIRGRVGSLLEVGTGFHPELSGRDNIYLNAAILGMRRAQVARRFDEIVEFSGIGSNFLDTPVKRYSSGMYVRLAFAVAAHLEPEILLVDEVLAVGDAEFQKRCLGKMESLGQSGRTVLFVSHNMPVAARLCPRLILLDHGHLIADGPTEDVIAQYLRSDEGTPARRDWPDPARAPGDHVVRLRSVRVIDAEHATSEALDVREAIGIELVFDVLESGRFVPWLDIYHEDGVLAFTAHDTEPARREPWPPGRYVSIAWLPENLLNEATYGVSVVLRTLEAQKPIWRARVEAAASFQVVDRGEGPSSRGDYQGPLGGVVRPQLQWTTRAESERPAELLLPPARR